MKDIKDLIAEVYGVVWADDKQLEKLERLVELARADERTKLQGQIETLHAMYELASRQRDSLMDEQRAQVAAMRGRLQ